MHGVRGSRPTLEAVAAHAGVSRATVSRVVNGGPGVRTEVRERVQRSVEELGYVPNSAARSLVTRRTGAVAVVIAEPETRVFSDPFFSQQLRGISRELSERDTQLLLMLLEHRRDYARIGRYLSGGHVDGALMFSLHSEDPLPAMAAESGLPTVFGGRPGWPGADKDPDLLYVDTDNRGGARQAVAHLLERGRRRIAVITGPLDQTSALDRLQGHRDALAAAGAAGAGEAHGAFTAEGGERAMRELLAREPELDAVFAGSDLMASGALRALRAAGRRVPEDVAVVGYDDLEPAAWADPPLTTVRQDVEGMGRMMAELLLRRLDPSPSGPLPTPVVTPAQLVVRASST
ncbi:LacI family transcriptional regulator [Streptomyces sp. RKND-216]|uniref:LacI family DNA-binding transcriptional regulator n=1 Tax=Streptomyces sp. RKND-216 TaxID=2562581 RepID=UPI00109DF617|nr:LacI family DNA-binding transcriptional regulator [Streptomyces sp. RKND-216]THA27113.1 LacI family transcriptional regulator [Streptomyces sp. RKND-216]